MLARQPRCVSCWPPPAWHPGAESCPKGREIARQDWMFHPKSAEGYSGVQSLSTRSALPAAHRLVRCDKNYDEVRSACMKKIRVGILFGGRSGEHEVSLLSAASVFNAIDKNKYEVVPIGITKEGRWRTSADAERPLQGTAWSEDSRPIRAADPQ